MSERRTVSARVSRETGLLVGVKHWGPVRARNQIVTNSGRTVSLLKVPGDAHRIPLVADHASQCRQKRTTSQSVLMENR
jgi:hypothetical protein